MKILRLLLFPFSLIYGFFLFVRNKLYDWNLFKSHSFNFPVISVGNLSTGGTGKTPHIEYLVRLLKDEYNTAILSKGYKRKSEGFVLAEKNSSFEDVGDEPRQYKQKFPDIDVAVDNKRAHGIKKLKTMIPELNIVLLDDAFQHRSVNPGINILITEHNKLYINDTVLPTGNLREFARGSRRADIIIVSKTPVVLSPIERRRIKAELKPKPYQKIYFSFVKYGEFTPITPSAEKINDQKKLSQGFSVIMLTGIANEKPFLFFLKRKAKRVIEFNFKDHHEFTKKDIESVKDAYTAILGSKKIIVTTEKDVQRLKTEQVWETIKDLPVFYIPIRIDFHGKDKEEFNDQILRHVSANTGNNKIHKEPN